MSGMGEARKILAKTGGEKGETYGLNGETGGFNGEADGEIGETGHETGGTGWWWFHGWLLDGEIGAD